MARREEDDETIEIERLEDRLRAEVGRRGTAVADVCRQMGVSEATFSVWKKKYTHLGTSEIRELRKLREKNAKRKRLVTYLMLDKHILTEVVRNTPEAGTQARTGGLGTAELRG